MVGKTGGELGGGAVHSAVQNTVFGPNMRQNMRRRRSFCRSKRTYYKLQAEFQAAPRV